MLAWDCSVLQLLLLLLFLLPLLIPLLLLTVTDLQIVASLAERLELFVGEAVTDAEYRDAGSGVAVLQQPLLQQGPLQIPQEEAGAHPLPASTAGEARPADFALQALCLAWPRPFAAVRVQPARVLDVATAAVAAALNMTFAGETAQQTTCTKFLQWISNSFP